MPAARMSRADGLRGELLTFAGALRCVTPAEYWEWAGKRGTPPDSIVNPLRRFCYDAEASWCQLQRTAGLCHLTDMQFTSVMQHHAESEDEVVTKPYREAPLRPVTPRPLEVEREPVPETHAPTAYRWTAWTMGNSDAAPQIAIERTGQLRVNPMGDHELGRPLAVQLLWCAAPRMIGIRTTTKDAPGAITLRPRGAAGGFSFGCSAFLRYHGIDFTETRSWTARLVEGVLVIDLDTPATPKRSWSRAKGGAR